ncbi:hydroxymethylpyrimidine/phosphomethylpyrimidine kinase [Pedobacter psychrotolerans]|uniref:hydroxymethylpyrimidine kinase n=1 Tax=Pedobacter psychrotolerans TaxID=1843235 RepID=A0A4R2H7W6_9SPHI|nr:bifunctional hydroxymethylpyrimidine kinase/phosphomethylpyrimidine kinase [Pedobacter psychrotolerans]TCO22595.1 hydroxymethylpyrimidine/phosphomethylpyrimidine kinase [Pedobacter psychrotolerans]GGE65741.1 hydroxymethylpyrimidine/phosphomethylpyrimidine kinase [Pedobacter psychrotolerans]
MSKSFQYISVLTIAGSDSGGGAGIQADLKTFSALGCYGTSAITSVTVQNTLGVTAIHHIPANIVNGQVKAVLEDIKPSAIKIGIVQSSDQVLAIVRVLKDYPHIPVILDPVMVSTSGFHLIDQDTIVSLQQELFPLTSLVTPNIDEAEILADMKINTIDDMKKAASRIILSGCKAILVKGGHLNGPDLFDVFLDENGVENIFRSIAVKTLNTHGTGCTLSAAIAAFVALGHDMPLAIEKAKGFVQQAIIAGQHVKTGEGKGPLNHFFDAQNLIRKELKDVPLNLD